MQILWLLYMWDAATAIMLSQCVIVYVSFTVCNVASSKIHYYASCKCYGVQCCYYYVAVTVCKFGVHMYLLLYVMLFLVEVTNMLLCKHYYMQYCCHYMFLSLFVIVTYICVCHGMLVEAITMLWCQCYCVQCCCRYMLLSLFLIVMYVSVIVMLLLVEATTMLWCKCYCAQFCSCH